MGVRVDQTGKDRGIPQVDRSRRSSTGSDLGNPVPVDNYDAVGDGR